MPVTTTTTITTTTTPEAAAGLGAEFEAGDGGDASSTSGD
jgi:hypothetical protein